MGKKPQTRAELKERLERYWRQEEGEAAKQAHLKDMTAKRYIQNHIEMPGGSRHFGRGRKPLGRFRPFARDDKRGRRPDVYVVVDKPPTMKAQKVQYCEYHKSKTHDTTNCSILKKEMEEKKLK